MYCFKTKILLLLGINRMGPFSLLIFQVFVKWFCQSTSCSL